MIDLRELIAAETGPNPAQAAMSEAMTEYVTIPAGRVGWAYRELSAAGIQPQAQRNGDGSHTFAVTDQTTGAILSNVASYQAAGRKLRRNQTLLTVALWGVLLFVGGKIAFDLFVLGVPVAVWMVGRPLWAIVAFPILIGCAAISLRRAEHYTQIVERGGEQ